MQSIKVFDISCLKNCSIESTCIEYCIKYFRFLDKSFNIQDLRRNVQKMYFLRNKYYVNKQISFSIEYQRYVYKGLDIYTAGLFDVFKNAKP